MHSLSIAASLPQKAPIRQEEGEKGGGAGKEVARVIHMMADELGRDQGKQIRGRLGGLKDAGIILRWTGIKYVCNHFCVSSRIPRVVLDKSCPPLNVP